ncbi:MAG: hypothetical protein AAB575_03965 [Patescibacteria group bacterium]
MTRAEFDDMEIGDTVQSAHSGLGYVIIAGDKVKGFTAVRMMNITNPDEWTRVQKPRREKE